MVTWTVKHFHFFKCTFILKPRFRIFMFTAVSLSLALRKMPERYNVVITNAWNWLQQFLFYFYSMFTGKLLDSHKWRGVVLGAKFFWVLMNSAETLLKFTSKESSCMILCKEQLCILLMQSGKSGLVWGELKLACMRGCNWYGGFLLVIPAIMHLNRDNVHSGIKL